MKPKLIERMNPDDLRMYLAVSGCRRAMQRGANALIAAAENCSHYGLTGHNDGAIARVAELARTAHHECAQARHRYQYYRENPPRDDAERHPRHA